MDKLKSSVNDFVRKVLSNDDELLIEILRSKSDMLNPLSDEVSLQNWGIRNYCAPPPPLVKRATLKRFNSPGMVWIETGTYKAETTKFLSHLAKFVYSIEPDKILYQAAVTSIKDIKNIQLFNGCSEEVLPKLLEKINFKLTGFWLDGHYSGDGTYKGQYDTPILHELDAISNYRKRSDGIIRVLIDDIRLFTGQIHKYGPYPTLDYLVDWSRELKLTWGIEHDIFIAHSK
jgi:hypothetical protein